MMAWWQWCFGAVAVVLAAGFFWLRRRKGAVPQPTETMVAAPVPVPVASDAQADALAASVVPLPPAQGDPSELAPKADSRL